MKYRETLSPLAKQIIPEINGDIAAHGDIEMCRQNFEYFLEKLKRNIERYERSLAKPVAVTKMRVINCERVVPCDIDGTLVVHESPPYTLNRLFLTDPYSNDVVALTINTNMVRLFREEVARGSHMLVWSRGGYQWAEAVIRALGLASEQVTIASKPFVYFDDLEVTQWMSERVFVPPAAHYKRGG